MPYVSSAMPQKRNPGLLINTRKAAKYSISAMLETMLIARTISLPDLVIQKELPIGRRWNKRWRC